MRYFDTPKLKRGPQHAANYAQILFTVHFTWSYFGSVTFTIPIGNTSIDFPQNLDLMRASVNIRVEKKQQL